LLLTHPGYSAHVLTLRCRSDQTVRMVTATNVSFLTVALYLLDLAIKVVALGLIPRRTTPVIRHGLAAADLVPSGDRHLGILVDR
jgi:hypothetical protein